MDYEKKYNEAFERAKEKYAMFEGMKQGDVLEDVFPELKESKESKDERTRKYIINHLQEHLKTVREFLSNGMSAPFSFEEIKMLEASVVWFEKQGEQKPWSEEDEKKISDILAILRGGENCHYNTHELFDWFKSIIDRVQPKQEWSEEDKQLINEVAECLRKYAEKVQGVNSTVYILSLADRIESLKPQKQWKPSDEQMKALWNVYQGGEEQAELATLYNDLKKLKA